MNIELMKKKRKELGLTQNELAEKCGVSKNTIYNYENGKSEPNKETLNILAEIFNVPVLELILNDDKGKIINDSNFDDILNILEDKFIEKIEKLLIKKYKNITKKSLDEKRISLYLDFILKSITGKRIIYSETIEKVIFFDIDKESIILYDFIVIEQYILNTISIIENLEKNNDVVLDINKFINLLDNEKRKYKSDLVLNKYINIFLDDKGSKIIKEYDKILNLILEVNSNEEISDKKFYEIESEYTEFEKFIKNIDISNINNIDKRIVDEGLIYNLKNRIKKEYDKLRMKYFKSLENKYLENLKIQEGDNNE